MKKKILVVCSLILFLLTNVSLSGQDSVLVIKKNTSGKEIYLQHGTNLNITCKDGHIFNGYLEVHNNRVFLFDK